MQFAKFVITRIIAYIHGDLDRHHRRLLCAALSAFGSGGVHARPNHDPRRVYGSGAGGSDARDLDASIRPWKASLAEQYFGFFHRTFLTREFRSFAVHVPDARERIDRKSPALDSRALADIEHVIAWIVGNAIGLLAGYKSRWISSRAFSKFSP